MTVATEQKIWTDEEFMALPRDAKRYELVNGELVDMGNSGMEHGVWGIFGRNSGNLCAPRSLGSSLRL
jgi:Uma2 family endonuclease